MGSLLVVGLGIAGIAVALWLLVTYWETERAPALALTAGDGVRRRFGIVIQRASGMITGAVVAGLLVPGIGGRLFMRVLAATSPESAQGRRTDADAIVGEITFGGSFLLIVFVGVFGGLTSLAIFVLLRRSMPRRSVTAGLVAAGIGGLFARPSALVDPENHDFLILSPVWLAVLSALLLIGLYGVLFVVLVDRWAQQWHPLGRSRSGLLAALPPAVVFVVAAAAFLPAVAIVAGVLFAVYVRPRFGLLDSPGARRLGRVLTAAAALAGAGWALVSTVQVLRL